MRACLAVLVIACNAAPPEVAVAPAQTAAVTAPSRPPVVARTPQVAAHGADIVALAVTADGTAVASADRLGGVRLWPVLDGTREPVVIRGGVARAIAISRAGADGFAIATLDPAGGVHLVQTTADGALRGHVALASEQPASQIESTSAGFVILWADQAISVIAPGGAARSRLAPEPGSHVDALVARGDRVLALVLEDKRLHGRWITLDATGARWGGETAVLPGPVERAQLSPDGALLAYSRPRSLHPVLFDLAAGAVRKAPLCVAARWPHEDGGEVDEAEFLRNGNAPAPIGFLSPTQVACSVVGSLIWWNADGTMSDVSVGGVAVGAAPAVVSARGAVIASGPSLALATPSAIRYLGYAVHDIGAMVVGPGGVVVSGAQHGFVLGDDLGERAVFETGRGRPDWTQLVSIDGRYAVTATERRLADRREIHQLAVFDAVTQAVHQLLPYELADKQLAYEPSTGLLAATDAAGALVLAYDPASHTLGAPVRLASAIIANRVALVDPRQAGGIAALELDPTSDGVLVGELALADLRPGALARPRASYRVAGEVKAIDRAGRLYVHRPDDGDAVVVITRGQVGARLAGVATRRLVPSPDGARIAAFAPPRLALFAGDGRRLWEAAPWSAIDVGWTAEGELVAQFPAAIARLDLATGALAARRCGLGFGLAESPPDTSSGAPSVCE